VQTKNVTGKEHIKNYACKTSYTIHICYLSLVGVYYFNSTMTKNCIQVINVGAVLNNDVHILYFYMIPFLDIVIVVHFHTQHNTKNLYTCISQPLLKTWCLSVNNRLFENMPPNIGMSRGLGVV
jgi:hypothetical protein